MIVSQSSSEYSSMVAVLASPPERLMNSTVSFPGPSLKTETTTSAPSLENANEDDLPIPDPPPVAEVMVYQGSHYEK